MEHYSRLLVQKIGTDILIYAYSMFYSESLVINRRRSYKKALCLGESEATTESSPLLSGRDCIAEAVDWKSFVEELRQQWRVMWRERIDDKVRAEGIAHKDFDLLFVDRGTVVVATRCYKYLDFKEILDEYEAPYDVKVKQETPLPHVGGWRKFGRKMAAFQRGSRKNTGREWIIGSGKNGKKHGQQQLKKGGRGWLHFKTK